MIDVRHAGVSTNLFLVVTMGLPNDVSLPKLERDKFCRGKNSVLVQKSASYLHTAIHAFV